MTDNQSYTYTYLRTSIQLWFGSTIISLYIDFQFRTFFNGALKAFARSRIIPMEEIGLIERIQELTDLELALLLSLVAGEHCIIQTEEEALDPLEGELELV